MRMRKLTTAALVTVAALAALPGTALARGEKASYIAVYEPGVSNPSAATSRREQRDGFKAKFRYSRAVKGFAADLTPGQLRRLESDPTIRFVSRDQTVYAVGSSQPIAPGDSSPTGIRRIGAATTTDAAQASTAGVAVIDTGIDLTHPDLSAVAGKNCVTPGTSPNDDNGHGSHVAGTIGARDNGSGVVGVAPGTSLYAVKVLNSSGSGTWSQVICGIDWVTANAATYNIKVASMSLGGSGSNDGNCGKTNGDALHLAICNSTQAGVTYVVAGGNDSANISNSVPAAYPEALTVSAESDSDGKAGGSGGAPSCRTGERDDYYASFSNYTTVGSAAANHVVAAPGVCIRSTWRLGGYNTISGTSMATPHVSGAVALCIGNGAVAGPCDGLTPSQVIQKIRSDAAAHATLSNGFNGDPLRPVSGRYYGYLVDPSQYVSFPPPPPNTPPNASFTATCTNLACSLDGSASSDPDGGTIVGYSWDFGDGSPVLSGSSATVSHTYASAGTYTVTLTVTDSDGGATGSQQQSVAVTAPPPAAISLSTSGYKVKGQQYVDLSWTGATTSTLDVYRNGTVLRTVDNTGSWTDALKRKGAGTYTYRVCEAGSTTQCSNDSTVVF
jgi:subtilisin